MQLLESSHLTLSSSRMSGISRESFKSWVDTLTFAIDRCMDDSNPPRSSEIPRRLRLRHKSSHVCLHHRAGKVGPDIDFHAHLHGRHCHVRGPLYVQHTTFLCQLLIRLRRNDTGNLWDQHSRHRLRDVGCFKSLHEYIRASLGWLLARHIAISACIRRSRHSHCDSGVQLGSAF